MNKKLENFMGKLGEFIYDNSFKVIVTILLLLIFPIMHISQIKIDTSTEGYLYPNDPILETYDKFKAQFGSDERIIVAIKNDNIFTVNFLNILKNIHEEIENKVPYLNDVTSLYNIRNTRGDGDKLITDSLLKPMPITQKQVNTIEKQAMDSPFYKDLFLSEDEKMTTIVIETNAYSRKGEKKISIEDDFEEGFDNKNSIENRKKSIEDKKAPLSNEERVEIFKVLFNIIDKYKEKNLEIYVAGSPVISNALQVQMKSDMEKFMRITILIIIVFLFIIFRRISAVVYPLVVIILSLLVTVGTMAWAGVALKLPTQIIPSLLLAISIGATVHILSIFFDIFNTNHNKKEAISETLRHSGLVVLMTSLTTAIGVGAFSSSKVAPISDMGVFASLGVMVSLLLTLILLPALLSITKLKSKPKNTAKRSNKFMKKLASIPIKYYKGIILGSAILVITALVYVSKIEPSHNPLFWFQSNNYTRISTETIDKKMNGTITIEMLIDTHKKSGWNNPKKLKKLDELSLKLETYTDEYTHIGKVISLATIIKETNKALHENKNSAYIIPNNINLVSQELLLFENSGSDDLEDFVDSQFSKTRISIKIPWTDAVKAKKLLDYIKELSVETFPNDTIEITGMMPLLFNTFSNAVTSSVFSYLITFIVISFMMILILNSVKLGLLSMIPNLTPFILGLLIMIIKPISLDLFTLLIGSIAMGLVVDDTIHFMHNFKRYYSESHDSTKAIEQTFLTTGKAMIITSIVLSLGFFSFMAANMISVQNFGLLTGAVIIFALLSDLFLAPALMIVAAQRGWIK